LRGWTEALVHPSVAGDKRLARVHRAFIGPRMVVGILAFAALPIFIVLDNAFDLLVLSLFAGLIAPIGAALIASRTGRLELARLVSAGSLVGAVGAAILFSGGLLSPVVTWLVVAPVESVERATRRELALGGIVAISTVGLVATCAYFGWTPAQSPSSIIAAPAFMLTALIFAAVRMLNSHKKITGIESALGRARESNRAILEHLSDLFTHHDETGGCVFASGTAKSLLGVDPRELLGQGLFQRVHVADRPLFLKTITDAGVHRRPSDAIVRLRDDGAAGEGNGETSGRQRAEPRYIWMDLRAQPVISGEIDEERTEVVTMMRNITALKLREEELDAARVAAEEANHSKSRFLAVVSHELRTPLNAVIGFAEMLANPDLCPKDPARVRDYATIINTSGAHLLDIVNTFLDASRIESGHFQMNVEHFDLAELVKSACTMVGIKAAGSGARVTTCVPNDDFGFEGDKRACRQIVINLVSNAVKFTPKGGVVKVHLRRVGSLVELSVDDTGIGIAASDLARLGEPFFQAKSSYDRPYEGTGLGLSVVRGLVGLHGGSLQIESTPGAGTCVNVTMPVERSAEAPSSLTLPRIAARPRRAPAQAVA
jgi:two-component system, cell cycle sensor histidine kinase DivJ